MTFNIPPADTAGIYLRVPREELVYLNGVLETYDDLGVIRTLDAAAGIAVLLVSPGQEGTARALLAALAAETGLEVFEPGGEERARWEEQIYG